jgi:hypothetical protein
VAVCATAVAPSAQAAKDLTIAPADPDVGNCWPFGEGIEPTDNWTPYFAFFYKNIPAFKLKKGDRLAFDLGEINDEPGVDIEVDISMAPMKTNGGLEEAKPFKKVVSNKNTPRNPRGDEVIGNFELSFKATPKKTFKFRGGGLAIRVSNPSDAYAADDECDGVLVHADATDPSGFFVSRAGGDADGVFPWLDTDDGSIGGFRVQKAPQTKIKGGPKGETADRNATFRLKSSERGSKFKCKLDGKKLRRCKKKLKLENLEPGKHKLSVKAKDKDNIADATPAKRKWTVLP